MPTLIIALRGWKINWRTKSRSHDDGGHSAFLRGDSGYVNAARILIDQIPLTAAQWPAGNRIRALSRFWRTLIHAFAGDKVRRQYVNAGQMLVGTILARQLQTTISIRTHGELVRDHEAQRR